MLVTNVGQGFGRAVALAYGRAGYHVVCADQDVDLASKTAAEVEELGGQAIPIQADMTTQMDVLTTYQKVVEIFGAIGGVVHLAAQLSTTPFENLAEGEFIDVMAENLRSSYLVLKTAARLPSVGWVVIVAPPTLGAVQMRTVQGALEQMIEGFCERFSYPRANLVLPSRTSADPRHDQALVRAVRYLGSHESVGVSGQIFNVDLPEPPQVSEALLPEVRAALDTSVRQEEEYGYLWGASGVLAGDDEHDDDHDHDHDDGHDEDDLDGDSDDDFEYDDEVALPSSASGGRHPYATLGAANDVDDHDGARLPYPVQRFDDDDDGEDDFHAFDLHWSQELGLGTSPALRHVVGDDLDALRLEESYAAGLEPAVDLYGDITRLDAPEPDDFDGSAEGYEGDYHSVVGHSAERPGSAKKRR